MCRCWCYVMTGKYISTSENPYTLYYVLYCTVLYCTVFLYTVHTWSEFRFIHDLAAAPAALAAAVCYCINCTVQYVFTVYCIYCTHMIWAWAQLGSNLSLGPTWIGLGSSLDLSWIQPGSNLNPAWIKLGPIVYPARTQLGSTLDPAWIQPGSIQLGSRLDLASIQIVSSLGLQHVTLLCQSISIWRASAPYSARSPRREECMRA